MLARSAFAIPDAPALEGFGHEVETMVLKQDATGFGNSFNLDAFMERVFRNVPNADPQIRLGFRQGFGPKIGQIVLAVPANAKFEFLHSRMENDEPHLVFRLLSEAGLNYWDLTVGFDPAGKLKVNDMHFAIMGENHSQSVQRLVLRLLAASDPKKGPSDAELKTLDDLQTLATAAREGRGDQALDIYARLPERYQRDKATQVMRVLAAAASSSPAQLDEVADDFKRRFGDDPACDLIMLDTHLTRKQYQQAVECIARIDKSIGGDWYLDVMSAEIQMQSGKLDGALASASQAQKRNPGQIDPIHTLVAVNLQREDFDAVKRWLLMAERAFNFRYDPEFNNSEPFSGFRKSPQYKQWLAERPKE